MALILSPKWLQSIVEEDFDLQSIADRLSQLGLETELIKASTSKIKNVVTGKVISTKQHPDADRLKVCEVDINSSDTLTIVCGCPTVSANMVVAVALDGAVLPEMTIKASKLRGVASQGMLCTALELGMSSKKGSLLSLAEDTPLGESILNVLSLDQSWMEVEITPNRGDCVSAFGVAREVAIALKKDLKNTIENIDYTDESLIGDIDLCCKSYAYAQIDIENKENLRVSDHIDYQLHVAGFNRVSPIIDILNYVMLYVGQPMHAFDFDKIHGKVNVRFAKKDELILLLDGQEIALNPSDLVIADDSGPIALAGIMGGENSKVTDDTSAVLLESACFDPIVIAKTAKRLGLVTDASYRYVRGTDPEGIERALAIALETIGDVCAIKTKAIGIKQNKEEKDPIRIGVKDVLDYLGLEISIAQLTTYMQLIGCDIIIEEPNFITVKTPAFRNDLCFYYDLIEEVARLIGYENLPKSELSCQPLDFEDIKLTRHFQIIESLVNRNYQEIYSLSLQSLAHATLFSDEDKLIFLDNPLSEEYAVMRPSILSSLVLQIKQCLNHFVKSGKLVEVGNCFMKPSKEFHKLGLASFGDTNYPEVNTNTYMRIKQDIHSVLHRIKPGLIIQYRKPTRSDQLPLGWHPNQTAEIIINDKVIGYVGKLHPSIQSDIPVETFIAELDLGCIDEQKVEFVKPRVQSKFPPSTRDLSFWVNKDDCAGVIKAQITTISELLNQVIILDDYHSEQDNQRSLTFRLTFQSFTKTLKDKEIDKIVENTVAILAKDGIKIRDH